jgi:hypothetical protein
MQHCSHFGVIIKPLFFNQFFFNLSVPRLTFNTLSSFFRFKVCFSPRSQFSLASTSDFAEEKQFFESRYLLSASLNTGPVLGMTIAGIYDLATYAVVLVIAIRFAVLCLR